MRTALPRLFSSCRVLALILLAALSTAPALAADPAIDPAFNTNQATLPAWDRLGTAQREQLIRPVRERWNAEPAQRARMLQHAQRWQQLTPDQRGHARRGLRRWEHLNPEQRTQMRALFEQMRGLPPEQRAELKQHWREMTPDQRRAWVQAHPSVPHPPSE